MKILIDIGHPGHIHLFKNLINALTNKGHMFLITVRDKDVTLDLMTSLNLPYYNRGKGYRTFFGKFLGIFIIDFKILKQALQFKPDILIGGVGNVYITHVAKIIGKPSIIFDDTEHSKFELTLVKIFSRCILTPDVFLKNLGKKQIKYAGFHELAYLHPKYFHPDKAVLKELNVNEGEKFFILRFISWNASHDVGQGGLSLQEKKELIALLKNYGKVFISSEKELNKEFEPYRFYLSPEKMHDALAFVELFIGEGATMASECAVLGSPAIYINSLDAGTLQDQAAYNLIYSYRNSKGLLAKVRELLENPNLKETFKVRLHYMLENKINVTAFMIWFIENYPLSFKIMKENPDYQFNYK